MSGIGKIEDSGWNSYFESKRAELNLADSHVARVIAEYKGAYKVKNENAEFLAKITGKRIFKAASREDYPAVGDWVVISGLDNEQAVIQAILPRRSMIKRVFGDKNRTGEKNDVQIIATNVDAAFIVQSVGRDFNVNRLERYLALVEDPAIQPVIIINKTDLISAEELASKVSEIRSRLADIDLIATSTATGEGLDELKSCIEKGKTYCFFGSSGVGKSSIINRLLGKDDIRTGDISAYLERGKHITTGREMYFLGSGGIVIDNPGTREVGMADASVGINDVFDEITVLAEKCKYADCTHMHEPGCEVLSALEEGRLDKERYFNYVSLKKETEYFSMSRPEKRGKDRNFGKFIKQAKKELKNYGRKNF